MKTGTLDQKSFTDKELTETLDNLVEAIQLMEHLYGEKAGLIVSGLMKDWYSLHTMADARGLEHSRP